MRDVGGPGEVSKPDRARRRWLWYVLGIGSLIDLDGRATSRFVPKLAGALRLAEGDGEALRQDWQAIGNDWRHAIAAHGLPDYPVTSPMSMPNE